MIEFAVTSDLNSLPNVAATLRNVYDLLAINLRGSIIDDFLMPGQLGGDRPTVDKGPWLKERAWQVWQEEAGYAPVEYVIGSAEDRITFEASPSTLRTQQFPDMDGIVASTDDAAGIRDGIRLAGNNVAIDFQAADNFILVLNYADTLIQPVNHHPGEKAKILVLNQGTQNQPDWDTTIHWPAATPPTIPPANAGETKGTYVVIRDIGGELYGEAVGDYAVANVGQG